MDISTKAYLKFNLREETCNITDKVNLVQSVNFGLMYLSLTLGTNGEDKAGLESFEFGFQYPLKAGVSQPKIEGKVGSTNDLEK